jgi:hypothetical protein
MVAGQDALALVERLERQAREPRSSRRGSVFRAALFLFFRRRGMRPVFLIVAKALGDERYWVSNLAAAGSFALGATPAENTGTF